MRKSCIVGFLIFCGLLFAGNTTAALYTWVDEKGVTHISDAPVAQDNDGTKLKKHYDEKDDIIWFDCKESMQRARIAAVEYLEEREGWPTVPEVSRQTKHIQNMLDSRVDHAFEAKLPDDVVKKAGCNFGQQEVKVRTEPDIKNPKRCRITKVELGRKKFAPASCVKGKKP
ncbi:MAG: DUF4124 domain-containing protein [Syntrophales bacterium]